MLAAALTRRELSALRVRASGPNHFLAYFRAEIARAEHDARPPLRYPRGANQLGANLMSNLSFNGFSGKLYEYRIITADAPAIHFPGNYLLVSLTAGSQPKILFAGEAADVFATLASSDIGKIFEKASLAYGSVIICD